MLSAAKHDSPRQQPAPQLAWRRDQQPVRCLDRCPGGTAEHASLHMSASSSVGKRCDVVYLLSPS